MGLSPPPWGTETEDRPGAVRAAAKGTAIRRLPPKPASPAPAPPAWMDRCRPRPGPGPFRILAAVALAALAAVLPAAAGGCDAGLPPEVAGRSYVDRRLHLALDVPAGWRLRESRGPVQVFLTAPPEGAGGAAVTVAVQKAAASLTAAELARLAAADLQRLPGLVRVATGERRLADGRTVPTAVFEHRAAGRPVRCEQVYLVAGGRAYVVTAAAAPPEAFSRYREAFETVFRSLRAGW